MYMMKRNGVKITGALLALTLFVLPAAPVLAEKLPGAGYSPVQLEAVQTKEMTYYKAGSASIPGTLEWVTGTAALKFLPLSVTGDVTSVVLDGGSTGLERRPACSGLTSAQATLRISFSIWPDRGICTVVMIM